jgi:hypothetical protein
VPNGRDLLTFRDAAGYIRDVVEENDPEAFAFEYADME